MIIYHSGSGLPATADLVGGKGANLASLHCIGQRVPPWFGVTTDAFREAMKQSSLDVRIREATGLLKNPSEKDIRNVSKQVREWILAVDMPGQLHDAIAEAHAGLAGDNVFVSVRSSAVDEDASGGSFAGLHDSFLFVPDAGQSVEAVKKVWASAFNERALAYRISRKLSIQDITIAAIVQIMVEARVSGVMFTANPNSGNVREAVVSALYGAGEGLVSAGLDADTYIVNKDSLSITQEIVPKEKQYLVNRESGGGLREASVPDADQRVGSLSEDALRTLVKVGIAIESHFRVPQDIEFSIDGQGDLFILQARPVTTVDELGPAAGNHLVWDNSNIIESYSGVTSPMTFSFIRRAYTIVYHCFSEVMGISPKVVKANRHTFENMLGLFRGEVYYNLFNWYRLVRLFPGFNYNKRFMESMMGVKEPAELADETIETTRWRKYLVELPSLVRLLVRSTWNFARIRRLTNRFQAHFDAHYGTWDAMEFGQMAPHELMVVYREMEDRLLWNWRAPIINDFFVMIFYGTLRKLCAAWCGDKNGSLQNDLLCGEGDIESTIPTKMLLNLARWARTDQALCQLIKKTVPSQMPAEIEKNAECKAFAAAVDDYLDRYGFRCMNELKLEEPSLRDRPEFLYQIIGNYLALDESMLDVEAMERRERKIRAEAESRVAGMLRGARGGLFKPMIFGWVLRNARIGVKNRENMRFARTKIYGLLREVLRALGRNFAENDLLDTGDDIFYLTLDEVWDFIKGTAVTTHLLELVKVRRMEFDGYRKHPERSPDDRFDTYGMAYHRNAFRGISQAAAVMEDGLLKGTGCCPGEVTCNVKVLLSPSDDMKLAGEILVAGRTDPGWVPLYPSVSGLLIERGSILSHSAIVAREMGIPTIVGIPGLITTLRTGQVVTMDGSAGTVKVGGQTGPDSTVEGPEAAASVE